MATLLDRKAAQQTAVPVTRTAAPAVRPTMWDVDRWLDQVMQGVMPSFFVRRMLDLEPFRSVEPAMMVMAPRVDLSETEEAYEITAELPGLEEKEVEVLVVDDMLTIKGEKAEEASEKEKTWHMTERRYGAFQRSFRLPANIDPEKVMAAFAKGVLTVTLPKAEEAKPRKIAIGK